MGWCSCLRASSKISKFDYTCFCGVFDESARAYKATQLKAKNRKLIIGACQRGVIVWKLMVKELLMYFESDKLALVVY